MPRREEAGISGSWWRWGRPLGGALVLLAVVTRLGTTPVVHAVRATEPRTLAIGAAVAVVTTTCAAWRWQVVARRLRVDLRMPTAVAACYRAQFLNATLPGGVLGDVGRAVDQGRSIGDVGRGVRAVVWERTSGQVILLGLTATALPLATLLGWAPPLQLPGWLRPAVALALPVVLLVGVGAATRSAPHRVHELTGGRMAALGRLAADDLRAVARPSALARITLASVLVVTGHVLTFVVAARAVGVRAPVAHLVPIALVVLVVGALPVNVGGWGPREGAAAWAFAASGLVASDGLAASVVYGTIAAVATAPGAVLLVAGIRPRRGPARTERAPVPFTGAAGVPRMAVPDG